MFNKFMSIKTLLDIKYQQEKFKREKDSKCIPQDQ